MRHQLGIALGFTAFLVSLSAYSQESPPFVGTWILDSHRSAESIETPSEAEREEMRERGGLITWEPDGTMSIVEISADGGRQVTEATWSLASASDQEWVVNVTGDDSAEMRLSIEDDDHISAALRGRTLFLVRREVELPEDAFWIEEWALDNEAMGIARDLLGINIEFRANFTLDAEFTSPQEQTNEAGFWRLRALEGECAVVETLAGGELDVLTLCPQGERMTLAVDDDILVLRSGSIDYSGQVAQLPGTWHFDEEATRASASEANDELMLMVLSGGLEAELTFAADGTFRRRIRIMANSEEWSEQSGTWSHSDDTFDGAILSLEITNSSAPEPMLVLFTDSNHICVRDPRDDTLRTPICLAKQ